MASPSLQCLSVFVHPRPGIVSLGLVALLSTTETRLFAQAAVEAVASISPGKWQVHADCLAVQPDGSILLGGSFGGVNGQARLSLARLSSAGVLDPSFTPSCDYEVASILIQADRRIVVGGFFNVLCGRPRTNIGRLNADGSLDQTFAPAGCGAVTAMAVQPDGKILVAGYDTLRRINTDGTWDGSLNLTATNTGPLPITGIQTLAIQHDGKILVGGSFTRLGGAIHGSLARVNPNGSLDVSFTPSLTWNGSAGDVYATVVLQDGTILVGGDFTAPATNLVKLKSNGAIDSTFLCPAPRPVFSLLPEADGDILVAGAFASLGRISTNGTQDMNFPTVTSWAVNGAALIPDGSVMLLGRNVPLGPSYTVLGRVPSTGVPRATISYDGSSSLQWFADGPVAAPYCAFFDISTNGSGWFRAGAGQPIPGGFQLSGVTLPAHYAVRLQGLITVGGFDSSGSYIESVMGFPVLTSQPASTTNNAGTAVTLAVSADGSLPLSYQWLKNGIPLQDSSNVGGSRSASLSVSNLLGADAGVYAVIVSNSFGSVTSRMASLVIRDPAINVQPNDVIARPGEDALFEVSTAGTPPLSYQWQRNLLPLSGATASSLQLTNVQQPDAGSYSVVVTGPGGVVTSRAAALSFQITADAFAPKPSGTPDTIALQSDGGILVGGAFSAISSYPCPAFARLFPDGGFDTNFVPPAISVVRALAAQPDGGVLAGGSGLERLLPTGTPDWTVTVDLFGAVNALAVQPDSRIIIGSSFTSFSTQPFKYIFRVTPDGHLDTTFGANADDQVLSLALQRDGRIVIGGTFTNLCGQPHHALGRANADGSLDATFSATADNAVNAIVVQPDGRILVGGEFTNLAGRACAHIGRLNPDGSFDTSFRAEANDTVSCLSLQADGRVLVGGSFTLMNSQQEARLARLNEDGTLDAAFAPGLWGNDVRAISIQPDGKMLIGGSFPGVQSNIGFQSVPNLARLNNMPAPQILLPTMTDILWQGGGSAPEFWRVCFECSTNGLDWNYVGDALPGANQWSISGLSLPLGAAVRARGFVQTGTSTWFLERTENVGPPAAPQILNDEHLRFASKTFGFRVVGPLGRQIAIEASTDLVNWTPLQTNVVPSTGYFDFSTLSLPPGSACFYRAR